MILKESARPPVLKHGCSLSFKKIHCLGLTPDILIWVIWGEGWKTPDLKPPQVILICSHHLRTTDFSPTVQFYKTRATCKSAHAQLVRSQTLSPRSIPGCLSLTVYCVVLWGPGQRVGFLPQRSWGTTEGFCAGKWHIKNKWSCHSRWTSELKRINTAYKRTRMRLSKRVRFLSEIKCAWLHFEF